jgi:hypothetical protein
MHRHSHSEHRRSQTWSQREEALLDIDLGLPLGPNDIHLADIGGDEITASSDHPSPNKSHESLARAIHSTKSETADGDAETVSPVDAILEPVDGFAFTREGNTIWVGNNHDDHVDRLLTLIPVRLCDRWTSH